MQEMLLFDPYTQLEAGGAQIEDNLILKTEREEEEAEEEEAATVMQEVQETV